MKEHDSRLAEIDEIIFYRFYGDDEYSKMEIKGGRIYIDSNNFVHNLNGSAWIDIELYLIHGQEYETKQHWEIEVNRLKMLEEI